MNIALLVHLQTLSWSGPVILVPVIVVGGIRRIQPRPKTPPEDRPWLKKALTWGRKRD